MLKRWLRQPVALACVAFVAVLAWEVSRRPAVLPAQALMPVAVDQGRDVHALDLQPSGQGMVPMPPGALAAHASSLLVMPPDSPALLSVFWFSGERESGPQVQIAMAQWDRARNAWSAPRVVLNRHAMARVLGFGIRRLGNPVAWLDASGRIHLYVVATGGGGWAASRILHVAQSSTSQALDTIAFEPQRVLPLSWLWNTSYMVRNAGLPLVDGGAALPVHFELGSKIPAVVRLDAQGGFVGVQRMSRRHHVLQPALLAQSPQQWVALMRDERSGGKIGVAQTDDGGVHWYDRPDLAQDNPDASVAALALAPGDMLLAHNPLQSGRERLDLSWSADGLQWEHMHTLAQGGPHAEFSYPAMAWAGGSLWVTYTVDRQRLAWQRLTPAGRRQP